MNSNEMESQAMTQMPTSTPLPTAPLFSEAPLLELPPGQSALAPRKPLVEMTDQELSEWDALQREMLTSPQTFAAHLRGTPGKEVKDKGPKVDISEYE